MEIFPYIERINKKKPYQLFCFPHAGGNCLTFAKWVDASTKIDIVPISLDERGDENSYDVMVAIISEKIVNILDGRPYYFYGHSMGAAFAFSVLHYCDKKYHCCPEKLIVAGRQPPYDKCSESFRSSMGMDALIDELRNAGGTSMELLESDVFKEYVLPDIMNDYKLHEGFKYRGEIINTPIVAHCGAEDFEANENIMRGWKKVTTGDFKTKIFSGGHFFPHNTKHYISDLEIEILEQV